MKSPSVLQMIRTLYEGREQAYLLGVCVLSVMAAAVETIGVASILPFMALVIDPTALDRFPALKDYASTLGIATPRQQLVLFGSIMVGLVALGNFVSATNLYVQQKFAAYSSTRLASKMFNAYLTQPYAFHVQRDVASIYKVVMGDVGTVVGSVVAPLTVAVGKAAVAIGIVGLLFIHDPFLSLAVAAGLVTAYTIAFVIIKARQRRLGELTERYNYLVGRMSIEGLYGVKDLQVLGRTSHVGARFQEVYGGSAHATASNAVIAQIPRYILETVAICGVLIITIVLVLREHGGAAEIIPLLALYAFAGYRLMPALQILFGSAVGIRFYLPYVKSVYNDHTAIQAVAAVDRQARQRGDVEMHFKHALEFQDVSFSYPGAPTEALRNINLTIRPNESIGLVGRTGAGKTTLGDLVLGLYHPTRGRILVDGTELNRSVLREWQKRVGFVSQSVFLTNATIAENIAFGLPPELIDRNAVALAAARAQADEFLGALPDGLDTIVGDRGIKLSGGQRQRIGIARALYHEPEILVFDEATSALDGLTEGAVMEAIESLSGERTVVLIAHRLTTIEACDRIVMLDHGIIVADGSYEALIESSPQFRELADGHKR